MKVVTATNKGTQDFSFDGQIQNVDYVIKANGFIKCTSGSYNGFQYIIPRGNEELRYNSSTQLLELAGRGGTGVNADYCQVQVEYTKTTD